jgi:hypothetical protein
MSSGRALTFSGPVRVMQRPELTQWTEVDGGGARVRARLCEGGRRRRGSEGENEKDPPSLFIRGWIQGMRGNRGGRNHHVAIWPPRFLGWLLR